MTDTPPLPPQVTQQQAASPLRDFAAQQGGLQGAQSQLAQAPPMQLVEQKLQQVAGVLEEIAKVIVQSAPQLIPVLKPVVQGLQMLSAEIKKSGSGNGGGGAAAANGQPAEASQQQNPGTPDASGAAAMGVQ